MPTADPFSSSRTSRPEGRLCLLRKCRRFYSTSPVYPGNYVARLLLIIWVTNLLFGEMNGPLSYAINNRNFAVCTVSFASSRNDKLISR